jgi:hypothetical protein
VDDKEDYSSHPILEPLHKMHDNSLGRTNQKYAWTRFAEQTCNDGINKSAELRKPQENKVPNH